MPTIEEAFGVGLKKLHSEMNAVQLAPLDRQIARLGCAAGENHGIEILKQLLRGIVLSHLAVCNATDPLGGHDIDPPLYESLVELHVGYAIHEQAADAVGALKDGDPMAGPVELRGAGQSRSAGANH